MQFAEHGDRPVVRRIGGMSEEEARAVLEAHPGVTRESLRADIIQHGQGATTWLPGIGPLTLVGGEFVTGPTKIYHEAAECSFEDLGCYQAMERDMHYRYDGAEFRTSVDAIAEGSPGTLGTILGMSYPKFVVLWFNAPEE